MGHYDVYLEFSGMTLTGFRIPWNHIPNGEITQDLLYHLFASGMFSSISYNDGFMLPSERKTYKAADMMRFVSERDRLEIRKLRAELAVERERRLIEEELWKLRLLVKEKADDQRDLPVAPGGAGAGVRSPRVGDPVREGAKEKG